VPRLSTESIIGILGNPGLNRDDLGQVTHAEQG